MRRSGPLILRGGTSKIEVPPLIVCEQTKKYQLRNSETRLIQVKAW